MKLKAGYKQTDVGVIPENWEVKPLKYLSPNQCVGVVVNPSTYFDGNGAVPFLVGSNIGENCIDGQSAQRINDASNQRLSSTRLTAGDLVTVRVGDPGVTAVVPPELEGCNCASMMIVRQHSSFNSQWLCYVMNSRQGRLQVENVQYGTAQKQFNISDAVNFSYPVPPLPEQRAIATALSDVDAFILAQDTLIAKKRDIKQAAMQQLLTGKQRLPGFSGEWGKQTIEAMEKAKLIKLSRGQVISKKDMERIPGNFPIYSSSVKKDSAFGYYGAFMFDEELITWSVDGGGDFFYRPKHKFSVTNVCGFMHVDTKKISYKFLAAQLQLLHGCKNFDYMSKAHPSVIRKAYEIQLPRIEEQTAIAAVLSDMDGELAALETQREKTRAIKQGMMQELLTGKTRLI